MNIRDLVLSKLAELTRFPAAAIVDTHSLQGDLQLDADDFSFLFVPALEKAVGTDIPQHDWDSVRTVGELIWMLEEKVRARPITG